jgi:hypothetical protein
MTLRLEKGFFPAVPSNPASSASFLASTSSSSNGGNAESGLREVAVASVAAVIAARDDRVELRTPTVADLALLEKNRKRVLYGTPTVDKLLQGLLEKDIKGTKQYSILSPIYGDYYG